MTYNSFNIVIEEETDYQETFVYLNPITNLPNDLTGFRAELQVRVGVNGDFSSFNSINAPLIYNTDTNGGILLGGTAGTIQVTIPYKDTYQLPWMTGDYSLILINPTGKRIPFLKGFFTVLANASKLGNSALTGISGTVASPNNQGKQGQDSNSPGVPSPSAGNAPPAEDSDTAIERLNDILEDLNY